MCKFFDPTVAESCTEPVAAEVRDKERANFCDYLSLKANAYQPASAEQNDAASTLSKLFDDDEKDATQIDPIDELEALFKKPSN